MNRRLAARQVSCLCILVRACYFVPYFSRCFFHEIRISGFLSNVRGSTFYICPKSKAEAVFHEFTSSSEKLEFSNQEQQHQYIAADGSTTSFFSFSKDYFISEGHSTSSFYSIHINAFYDINNRIYTDAIL